MHGRLWVDVMKNDRLFVLPNNFRRYLSCDDFFENGHDVSEVEYQSLQVNLRNPAPIQARKLEPSRCITQDFQCTEQFSRAKSVAGVSLARTKQPISSRGASQARVQVFTPRRCFTRD